MLDHINKVLCTVCAFVVVLLPLLFRVYNFSIIYTATTIDQVGSLNFFMGKGTHLKLE